MPAYLAQPVYQQTLAPIQDKAVLQTSAGAQMSLSLVGSSTRSALRPGSSATTLTPSTTSTSRAASTGAPPSGYVPRMPTGGGSSSSAAVSTMTDPSVPAQMPLYDPGEQAAAERGELPEYLAARDAASGGAGVGTMRTALAVGVGFAVGISAMWFWRR